MQGGALRYPYTPPGMIWGEYAFFRTLYDENGIAVTDVALIYVYDEF